MSVDCMLNNVRVLAKHISSFRNHRQSVTSLMASINSTFLLYYWLNTFFERAIKIRKSSMSVEARSYVRYADTSQDSNPGCDI